MKSPPVHRFTTLVRRRSRAEAIYASMVLAACALRLSGCEAGGRPSDNPKPLDWERVRPATDTKEASCGDCLWRIACTGAAAADAAAEAHRAATGHDARSYNCYRGWVAPNGAAAGSLSHDAPRQ